MDRLTKRERSVDFVQTSWVSADRSADALCRLADYEDTGLTPEAVQEMLREVIRLAQESVKREVALAKLEAEVSAWAEEEKDGRLIVLPCKVGDTVYEVTFRHKCDACPDNQALPVEKCKLYNGKCTRKHEWRINELRFDLSDYNLITKRLKQGIYLTRAEAEAALAEEGGAE